MFSNTQIYNVCYWWGKGGLDTKIKAKLCRPQNAGLIPDGTHSYLSRFLCPALAYLNCLLRWSARKNCYHEIKIVY